MFMDILAEKEVFVYKIGEYVICGNKGVCEVESITTLDISGVDKGREYYILKPRYMAGSTVYVPVDSSRESMRPVLNRDEAEKLIDSIPQIPMLTIINEKLTEQAYRDSMKTNKWEEWVRVGHGVTTTRTPHTGVLLNLQTSPQDQEQTLTPHKAIERTFPI